MLFARRFLGIIHSLYCSGSSRHVSHVFSLFYSAVHSLLPWRLISARKLSKRLPKPPKILPNLKKQLSKIQQEKSSAEQALEKTETEIGELEKQVDDLQQQVKKN